jgi:adhesin transport system membrane fusion protein
MKSDRTLRAMTLVQSEQSAQLVAALLTGLLVLLALLLLLVPWQQSVSGSGRTVAYSPQQRTQNIEAPLEGRVVRFFVHEGSQVAVGDPIAEISDNDPSLMLRLREERDAVRERQEAARARLSSLDDRINSLSGSRRAAMAAASSRTRMAKERLLGADQALQASEATQKTAQLNLVRQQGLFEKGLSATRALELSDLEAVRTRTEVDRARATQAAARNELLALRQDELRVGTDASALLEDVRAARATALAEIANATAELARIEVRLARQASQSVKSPTNGTILRLLHGVGGDMVKAGDPLATLVPDTDSRAVELWVDGNDVPLLAPGQPVRLQFEGWPAVQFVGWPSVAIGTFPGKVAVIDATDNGKGKFRALVVPDEKRRHARALAQQDLPTARRARQRLGTAIAGAHWLRAVETVQWLPSRHCAHRAWSHRCRQRRQVMRTPPIRQVLRLSLSMLLMLWPVRGQAEEAGSPLLLPEVMESIRRAYPLIVAALADRRAAEGELQAARGGFDPMLRAKGDASPFGNYRIGRFDLLIEQPTPLWGGISLCWLSCLRR